MAPVEDRNVRSMFLTSFLDVIFGLKLLVFFPIVPCAKDTTKQLNYVEKLHNYLETIT